MKKVFLTSLLLGTVAFSTPALAQQYGSDVQVNWDALEQLGPQPTIPGLIRGFEYNQGQRIRPWQSPNRPRRLVPREQAQQYDEQMYMKYYSTLSHPPQKDPQSFVNPNMNQAVQSRAKMYPVPNVPPRKPYTPIDFSSATPVSPKAAPVSEVQQELVSPPAQDVENLRQENEREMANAPTPITQAEGDAIAQRVIESSETFSQETTSSQTVEESAESTLQPESGVAQQNAAASAASEPQTVTITDQEGAKKDSMLGRIFDSVFGEGDKDKTARQQEGDRPTAEAEIVNEVDEDTILEEAADVFGYEGDNQAASQAAGTSSVQEASESDQQVASVPYSGSNAISFTEEEEIDVASVPTPPQESDEVSITTPPAVTAQTRAVEEASQSAVDSVVKEVEERASSQPASLEEEVDRSVEDLTTPPVAPVIETEEVEAPVQEQPVEQISNESLEAPEPAEQQIAALTPAPDTSLPSRQRILFAESNTDLGSDMLSKLDTVAATLRDNPNIRAQLFAYASGQDTDTGHAQSRRVSLSRALEIRNYLVEQGVPSTRLDVRALGQKYSEPPSDRVDIIFAVR